MNGIINPVTFSLPRAETAKARVVAKVDFAEVPMQINIEAYDDGGEDASVGIEAIVCVTNWIAYESNFPNQPTIQTYNMGDEHTYQIVVDNIAVTKLRNYKDFQVSTHVTSMIP